jgi:hypothetical protein
MACVSKEDINEYTKNGYEWIEWSYFLIEHNKGCLHLKIVFGTCIMFFCIIHGHVAKLQKMT